MVPRLMIFGLAYALTIMVLVAALLKKGIFGKKSSVIIAATTVLIGGLILGGVPDPVTQIYQFFQGIARDRFPLQPLVGIAVLGALALLTGRLFCGYACPLGAAQELMSRVTSKKVDIDRTHPRLIRGAFTMIFIALAMLTPAFLAANPFRFFALEFAVISTTFFLIILAASTIVYRPWCRLLCPFGALAELISRRSFFRLRRTDDCVSCERCVKVCPTGQPTSDGNMSECYYCGRCLDACPRDSMAFTRKSA